MSGLPQSYGVQFPTAGGGGGNPYPPSASSYSAISPPPPQQQQVQIQPGSITYTTSTLPDGRIQYNQFKAESRSYQTPQGPVHGIQWIPVNVSYELPSNAQPAGPDFHASWSRPSGDRDSQRTLKEWQRDQEKRAKREEKESAKRMKEWERDRREREKAEEKELRRAQERDLQRGGRGRRLSNVGFDEYEQYPTAAATAGFPRARSRSRVGRDSVGQDELTRAMAEMAMEKDWAVSEGESRWGKEPRERRGSNVGRPRRLSMNAMAERPRRLSTSEYERPRKTSVTPYPSGGYTTGAANAYPNYRSPSPARGGYSDRGASPYRSGGGLPPTHGVPVYPPGHIYAGKPIPGMQGDNLGTMGGAYGPPSPRRQVDNLGAMGGAFGPPSPRRQVDNLGAIESTYSSPSREALQPETPAGFSRPPSLAVPYTYFDPILVMADLNEFFQQLPVMPAVLGPHDVWVEDWIRCLEDLASAWIGKLPIKERHRTLKPHTVVAQLIDVWNASFFSLRGVELVLFRGRQRRSGPHAGKHDTRLGFDPSDDDESDTISSVSSDSDAEDKYAFYGGAHARRSAAGGNHWLADSTEARRIRKAEKRLREKQKRKRRERERVQERGSGFSLYLTCTDEGQSRVPRNSGYPPVTPRYLG